MTQLRQLINRWHDPAVKSPLVLICQMGKVGSQTVEATLRACMPDTIIFRLHFISEKRQAEQHLHLLKLEQERKQPQTFSQIDDAAQVRTLVHLRRWRNRLAPWSSKVKIISGVREPVGHRLAGIFQNHTQHFPSLADATVAACEERLRNRIHKSQDWFDRELKAMFGIDVFARPFPHERGYAFYENAFAHALVYRFENLDRLPAMLAEFFHIPPPETLNRNVSAEKEYSHRYADVKRQICLPDQLLNEVFSSKIARHFYTDAERQAFRRRWQNRSVPEIRAG